MSRRSSARLAKANGKHVKAHAGETPTDLGQETNPTHTESEQEVESSSQIEHSTNFNPKNRVARRKQVRGKQGRLANFVNMPMDIFVEVASHLLPGDIITLARSNKFFRNLLMHRSAIHIWHGAMKNMEGLPPCPPNMSEPHYLSLLFSKTCSMCGGPVQTRMDPDLFVRLCGPCQNVHLVPIEDVPVVLLPFLSLSVGMTSPNRHSAIVFVLRADLDDVRAQYNDKKRSPDDGLLKTWIEERKALNEQRREHTAEVIKFRNALALAHEKQMDAMKLLHQSETKRRLSEIEWTENDMEFGSWSTSQRTWNDLVFQPKPLTDRTWANLRPKLIPLLETNRKKRWEAESESRKRA